MINFFFESKISLCYVDQRYTISVHVFYCEMLPYNSKHPSVWTATVFTKRPGLFWDIVEGFSSGHKQRTVICLLFFLMVVENMLDN